MIERILQHELEEVQGIINTGKAYRKSPEEILSKIERHLSTLTNKVVKENSNGYYTITSPANNKGKYIVPEHKDIPKRAWGAEVDDRQIVFKLD